MKRISRRTFHQLSAAAGASLLSPLATQVHGASKIARRPFGNKGFDVTMLGLGGGGRFFEIPKDDEAGAEIVRQAIERGVEFIETAANYGPKGDGDRSERRIGLAMKTHRRRVFLETKIDARDYDGAMREMERSLKLFHTDQIDLMLHHAFFSKKEVDRVLAADGAEKAIRKMIDQKAIRFRGFSCHSPELALDALGRIQPDAVQFTINATRNPDFEAEVLPLCKSKGIAVMAMKTCGHGFFTKEALQPGFDSRRETDKDPGLHRFAPPAEVFQRPSVPTPDEFLRYALSLPLTVAVAGMESIATVESAVRTALAFKPLKPEEMASIHQRAQSLAGTGYWIPRTSQTA
jgi:aryl-alcohol dehydrogenase-like predicted oxidoreductase